MSDQPDNRQPDSQARWRPSRRTFLWLGAGAAAGALLVGRTCFYDADDWHGHVLDAWEASVVAAAATAIIPDKPGELPSPGPTGLQVAHNLDHFLVGMPHGMLLQIHAMFGLIEHGTILDGSVLRFTRLDPPARLDFLLRLRDMGGKFGQVFKGIRDLTLLGWYADPRTWKAVGYDGPLVDRPAPAARPNRAQAGNYGHLMAKPGQTPRGTL